MEQNRSSWCWGWSGIGALAALALALAGGALRRTELAPPGPVALWAADRDAGLVYGLDEELILACRVRLPAPLALARARDGRLFVLRAPGILDVLDSGGAFLRELEVGACLDLDAHEESALLVQPSGALRIGPDIAPTILLRSPGLCCIAGSLASVLAGTQDGRVLRLALDGSGELASAALGGSIVDLAPAAEPGGSFALDAAGQRLLCLAPDLALRWQVALPIAARQIGAVPGEERVWLADTGSPRVLRYGPGGALELDRAGLPLLGLERALAWSGRGALVCAPGALLQLDARGHLAPGQGGFNYLVDLAR
jgi:hypothetical protein